MLTARKLLFVYLYQQPFRIGDVQYDKIELKLLIYLDLDEIF